MIPQNNEKLTDALIGEDIEISVEPSLTYAMQPKKSRIEGFRDELDAMRQAVYKIVHTERYKYPIYDWNYGIELNDLFGMPIPFIYSMIKVRIQEALEVDERIIEVIDFKFSNPRKHSVHVEFTVRTIFGDIDFDELLNLRR